MKIAFKRRGREGNARLPTGPGRQSPQSNSSEFLNRHKESAETVDPGPSFSWLIDDYVIAESDKVHQVLFLLKRDGIRFNKINDFLSIHRQHFEKR